MNPAEVESLKQRMREYIESLQEEICSTLERLDGKARFREDLWTREGGGGGRSRIIEEGAVFEKGGVNISAVFGELEEAFARRLQGTGRTFFAAGLSLVLHPRSPRIPTVHANYRFIVQGDKAWFGGGADLTPYYLVEEDGQHFHRTLKAVCDKHPEVADYARFKKTCDEYFFLRHRDEARGLGGIFFENVKGPLEAQFAFVQDAGRAFLPGYVPIVERHKDEPYGEPERTWQELRRGRYVEFNLLYDRGTTFGLETKGRVESILMSLPPHVQWKYGFEPSQGSEEARLLAALRTPREWV